MRWLIDVDRAGHHKDAGAPLHDPQSSAPLDPVPGERVGQSTRPIATPVPTVLSRCGGAKSSRSHLKCQDTSQEEPSSLNASASDPHPLHEDGQADAGCFGRPGVAAGPVGAHEPGDPVHGDSFQPSAPAGCPAPRARPDGAERTGRCSIHQRRGWVRQSTRTKRDAPGRRTSHPRQCAPPCAARGELSPPAPPSRRPARRRRRHGRSPGCDRRTNPPRAAARSCRRR